VSVTIGMDSPMRNLSNNSLSYRIEKADAAGQREVHANCSVPANLRIDDVSQETPDCHSL